jgi:hypothetical protein
MATIAEQEKLIEVLKFTPRTYKITMWGYGGEKVMGTVDRKIYDYFKHRRLDLSDYCWDSDYADDNNIPEDMQPFPAGSWYECDSMGHAHGVVRNAGTLQIQDENEETVYECSLDNISGGDDNEPEWGGGEEVWIDEKPAGTVVFIGNSNEKGTFFEADIPLTQPFDIAKLTLGYDDIDGEEFVNKVEYDGEEIDNWGGNTNGKSSDFGFYIAHSQKATGSWEKYTNMDDITYEMTEWFSKKINPAQEGVYLIRTPGKNSYTYQCKWTGSKWVGSYISPEDFDAADEVKIKEWQGLAANPDAAVEWDPAVELQKIVDQFEVVHETNTDNLVDFPQTGWPFAGPVTTPESEISEPKTWIIRTHYKKSCEQHEYFYNREIKGGEVKVTDGYRSCEYTFETEDGEFPDIQFTTVPGGEGKKDSIDLNSCFGSNVDNTELVEMFDGGCWGDTEVTGIEDEDEVKRLTDLVSEEGSYALEEDGNWYLSDTEVWAWGPLEVEDDEGNVRIVIADENGNMIDFVEE